METPKFDISIHMNLEEDPQPNMIVGQVSTTSRTLLVKLHIGPQSSPDEPRPWGAQEVSIFCPQSGKCARMLGASFRRLAEDLDGLGETLGDH